MSPLTEGVHFYFDENGLMVFTEKYHLDRGYCCNNGCRHCPYQNKSEKDFEKLLSKSLKSE